MGKKTTTFMSSLETFSTYLNDRVKALNQSKIFAGVMIVIINIASKFVTFKVSKTVESYLKFTFSRHMLVFAATWLGT
jgi:fluoride ion exporter CrcB/FEX